MSVIRIPAPVWTLVHRHLYATPGEHFAFLRARFDEGANGPVFLVREAILVPDEQVSDDGEAYQLELDGILDVVNTVVGSSDALIEVHNHGGRLPRFSRTDREQLPDFIAFVRDSLPDRPYAATVWGDDSVYGEWFASEGRSGVVRGITVLGDRLRQIVSRDDDDVGVAAAFDRQLPWFSAGGQRELGRFRVAIVGAGGTGSHIVQLLAYLGVRDFVIVEHDAADETSMNRLVTACQEDLDTPKGILARRLIRSVAPAAQVELEQHGVPSEQSLQLLKDVDVIFGCVDDEGPRLVMNAIALAYRIPYFDLAVGIDARPGGVVEAGGRLAAVIPGGPCLHCMRQMDLSEARHWLRSPDQRVFAQGRGYVIGAHVPAPAVVSLNAALAAAAVNEFSVLVSGFRNVQSLTELDLLGGARAIPGQWLTPQRVDRNPHCVECSCAGLAADADVERFVRRRNM